MIEDMKLNKEISFMKVEGLIIGTVNPTVLKIPSLDTS